MSDKTYSLESNSVSYSVGFEGDIIYCEMFRRLKECRLDQVTKVVQKKTTMGLGDEISFRIYFMENGVEKKFPWIQVLVTSPETKAFFDDLKSRLGSQVAWEDKREQAATDESGAKVFDLQFLPFGYAGSGLSRTLQIWIYLICLAILVIPLILLIIILVKGGYRIYTNEEGIEVRKLGSKKVKWEDIEEITFQQVKVTNYDTYQSNQVAKVRIKRKNGGRISFVMRYDHAIPFMKELAEHDVIDEEMVGQFV